MGISPVIIASMIAAGGATAGAAINASGAKSAAQTNAGAATSAGELQAQAAANALAFEQQQADVAQKNFLGTQQFNRQVYNDQQARLAPYRAAGAGAIAQLGQPIPGMS